MAGFQRTGGLTAVIRDCSAGGVLQRNAGICCHGGEVFRARKWRGFALIEINPERNTGNASFGLGRRCDHD